MAEQRTAFAGTHMSKTFPGQVALNDVAIEVHAGEIHALVGQNGSGKSTFVKLLAGYHQPDPGATAAVLGEPFELGSAVAARAAGLRFVHQDLGLIEALSVSDNFHLVDGAVGSLAKVDRRSERKVAAAALAELGYTIDPGAEVSSLSESERTALALARALSNVGERPALLVLDEVTASLPGAEVDRLFAALRRIAASGVAILFISHHLDEVLDIADRVTVLRDGRLIITVETGELSHDGLVELLLGRALVVAANAGSMASPESGPAILVRRLSGRAVVELDLDVAAGEVIGVAGLTGSGREELAGLLTGRLPRTGEVRVGDSDVPAHDPAAAIELGLCLVPADRAAHALLPGVSVCENLTLADVSAFWSNGVLSRSAERAEVQHWIEELDVRPPRSEAIVTVLSGGNQQKVVMARWLRVRPKVLVLDEPTQGVDVGSKADIHRLVDGAAAGGAAVIVCSTDSDELARLADRVLVLHRGRVVGELTGDDLTVEQIEHMQLAVPA